ncbi:c-type cytochrome [Limnohabitans planktonicus]|jgi:cytochrome c553|uniref:Cytochrome c4 n=1 Tax=Limnohabitans planktonicus II-D5 TaxID=1293045 RepID=A0A2T7UDN2_9BURK|nr:c-type cytochrome [Limnohabitans planktonicus]PVE42732.1 cytochrome c4 [Limnohabitans planktonicus II-D5]|eukprot:gene1991-1954_t
MNKLLTSMFALAVASVTAISVQAQEIKGDAKAAEQKIAMCIGCHGIKGYQASFPEVYRVPMISGQNAKYISTALNAYKKGDRKHPTMRGISDSLSDQDIADLAAYYELHGKTEAVVAAPKAPDAKVAALLQKGACISCHGDNFSKPVDPSYPKIAGQHKDYLFVALKSYKVENLSTWGRSNGVMGGIAKQFSNAELKAMAAYIGSLEGDMKVVPQSKFR